MSDSLKGIQFIDELPIAGKCVFIRVDFNVPVVNGEITDDSRIKGALPTIKYALEQGAKVVLGSHFGRPKSAEDRQKYSLELVAERLQALLEVEVILVEDPVGDAPKALIKNLKQNQIILLENLRFEPSETKNEDRLVEAIKQYAEVYINDAFGASHRAHASIVGLPAAISLHGMGLLMKKEIEMLDTVIDGAESPYVAILGGAKVSDKIPIIENLIQKVDDIIIGGAMAYTFLNSQGIFVGSSLVEKDQVSFCKKLIERMETRGKRIHLPVDHLVALEFSPMEAAIKVTPNSSIPEAMMGLDIGPKTIELYASVIKKAKTIFWNGPMGVFENKFFCKGTFSVAEAIAKADALSIVGGGDSASAARLAGVADQISHISTGGGASLEYLQGDLLPGVLALKGKYKPHMVDKK